MIEVDRTDNSRAKLDHDLIVSFTNSKLLSQVQETGNQESQDSLPPFSFMMPVLESLCTVPI